MTVARGLVLLVLLQAALVGAYLAVESVRVTPAPFGVEALDEPAPPLAVERAGAPVAVPPGPHLVHFWATWCAPCVVELPALLAAAEAEGLPLLAVTDEPWPAVAAFFDGDVPTAVVRDPRGDAAAVWRVSGLPDTFVVVDGRVVGRMGGPRRWESPDATAYLRGMGRTP